MKEHWENIYKTMKADQVSWFQPHLSKSLDLILKTGIGTEANIIDVGGGASTLVDDLLEKGFSNISVLDMSVNALEVSKKRLGKKVDQVDWIEGDITTVKLPKNHYDLWHDRAVFHFLTKKLDRNQYVKTLSKTVKPNGHVIISTFGPEGPLKCSGLNIVRYSGEEIKKVLGNAFQLLESIKEIHKTPFDTEQEFMYFWFQKRRR